MAGVSWVKITVDMFDNRKIKHLRRLPEGNSIVLIWVMLLTMAGRCNANGMIFLTEDIPYSPKMLADELDFEENTVVLALEALERLNMVHINNEGFYSIAGWEEYQNVEGMELIREQNRLRKARYDAKRKSLAASNVTGNVTVTCGNAIEEEREEEKEEEKEKEYHSFIQANENSFSSENVEKAVENSKRSFLQGSLGKGVVLLSEEQLDDLLDKLSFDEFNKYVGIVADNELCGKHYRKKTHHQAILDMAMKDRKLR